MHRYVGTIALLIICSMLAACTYESTHHYPKNPPKADDLIMDTNVVAYYPYQINIYSLENIPEKPYHIIGEVSASCYNGYGILRQRAQINRTLRQQAAEQDGDAIIILNPDSPTNLAEVIKFDKSSS